MDSGQARRRAHSLQIDLAQLESCPHRSLSTAQSPAFTHSKLRLERPAIESRSPASTLTARARSGTVSLSCSVSPWKRLSLSRQSVAYLRSLILLLSRSLSLPCRRP